MSNTENTMDATKRERSYEYGLPEYLQHDLDAYKDGLKNGSNQNTDDFVDCFGRFGYNSSVT